MVNNSIPVIGITGRARAGKDTIAEYLVNEFNYQQFSFAAALKDGMLAMTKNIPNFDLSDENKERVSGILGVSPRQFLQRMGTDFGRVMIHQDIWIIIAETSMDTFLKKNPDCPGIVFSDVRFENEAEFIRRRGTLVHVSRPGGPVVNAHVSEQGVVAHAGDISLINSGTIEELHKKMYVELNRTRVNNRL